VKDVSSKPTPAKVAKALLCKGPLDMNSFIVDSSKSNSGSQFVGIAVVSNGRPLY
jgi:hypothetical protein